jgi:uncharacterized protein (TIGR00369 family)
MTDSFIARDPDFAARVRESFARQRIMQTLGAALGEITPGAVDIALDWRADLVQQHGFLHAGVLATIADSACGYAALSLMEAGAGVLSIEFKVNMLSPARGPRIVARGRVIRPGRTIMVCRADVVAPAEDGGESLVAIMQGTMMVVRDRAGVRD